MASFGVLQNVYLKMLIKRVGILEASRLLGYSLEGVKKISENAEVRTSTELAAKLIMTEMSNGPTTPPVSVKKKLMIVSVPEDKRVVVESFLTALGMEHKEFEV